MGNCLSNCDNKSFFVATTRLAPAYLKKLVSGVQKYHVKNFATCIQRIHLQTISTHCIKSSL